MGLLYHLPHVNSRLFLLDVNESLVEVNGSYIFSTDFRKINTKFHENPSSASRVVPCGPMDEHDEGDSCFPQFANASRNDIEGGAFDEGV
jgi:hypothetical protein